MMDRHKHGLALAANRKTGQRIAQPVDGTNKHSSVAKVSHTLSVPLAERLEEFAFFQRVSESAVIEYSLNRFFETSADDAFLGELLRKGGAGRRRRS
ncbi:MAG: hypothetical protein ACREM6_07040 [Vulcanimicrobiaceae bacterium]